MSQDENQLTKEEIIEKIRKNEINLKDKPKYQNDKELILEAVKKYGLLLKHASEELKADKEVVLEAVKSIGSSLKYASEELRSDREIVLEAVKSNHWALIFASKELQEEIEKTLKYKVDLFLENNKKAILYTVILITFIFAIMLVLS